MRHDPPIVGKPKGAGGMGAEDKCQIIAQPCPRCSGTKTDVLNAACPLRSPLAAGALGKRRGDEETVLIPQRNESDTTCRTDSKFSHRQDLPEVILLSLHLGDLGFINEAEQDIAINLRQPDSFLDKVLISTLPGTKAISPE